jgi:DNA-binding transcriptional regulator LsrR (DeoR family)
MISMKTDDDFAEKMKEYLPLSNANYRRIFEGQNGRPPEIGHLDVILTSLGNLEQENKLWKEALRESGSEGDREVVERLLKKLHDIGGVLIVDNELDEEEKDKLRQLESRWLGIKRTHYYQCAQKAKPGVIVVALGDNKAETTLRAVKRGLVNILVIDEDLARRIGQLRLAEEIQRRKRDGDPNPPQTYCSERFPSLRCLASDATSECES